MQDDIHKKGYNAGGELGLFLDAIEDESSDDEPSADRNLPSSFAHNIDSDNNSIESGVFLDADDELPLVEGLIIDSDCLVSETALMEDAIPVGIEMI